MPRQQPTLEYAVEVMLDFLAAAADGKDDDELVFIEADVQALAQACGVEPPEIEPMTAGEIRQRARAGKGALARGGRASR